MSSVTSVPTKFSLEYLQALRDIQYHMVAALSLLVWDSILTLEVEIEYIWRMRRCAAKWFYFYFRYFLLAAQLFHLAILPTLSDRMPDFLCKMWYWYMMFIMELSSCMVGIILSTRVFSLYNRSRKVGNLLGILILLEVGVTIFGTSKFSTMEYLEACIAPRPQKEVAYPLGTTIIAAQSIIMGMLLWKYVIGTRLGWERAPLLTFLVRDATSYYVGVSLMCCCAMTIRAFDDMRIMGIIYWSVTLFSAVGCRLILNMERFVRENRSNEEIVLTSRISL